MLSLQSRPQNQAGFFLGGGGVIASAALIAHSFGDKDKTKEMSEKYGRLSEVVLPLDYLPKGSDEMLVGRAGYLCGLLNLRYRQVGSVIYLD